MLKKVKWIEDIRCYILNIVDFTVHLLFVVVVAKLLSPLNFTFHSVFFAIIIIAIINDSRDISIY